MNFANLITGDSLLLDANVFVYAFGLDPIFGPASKILLKRIESGDLTGYISSHIFNDIAYRILTLDACQTFGWPYAGIGKRLRRHPSEIPKLLNSRRALDEIIRIGIRVLSVNAANVLLASDLSRQHGLLSGDGLIVAIMQTHNLKNLASNDSDFDRVSSITRFVPL